MNTNPENVLRQKDWSGEELAKAGFRFYTRIKHVVLVRRLSPEEAPLKIKYGQDELVATAGYMICFSAGWLPHWKLYAYHHWPVAPEHFADSYLEWDEPSWKPKPGERRLLSLGCKAYYNAIGVWAKKLEAPQWIQNPEQTEPFEVPAGAWLILGSKGSLKGVPWWAKDKGFKQQFVVRT